ncbi:MAG: SDR family NAD(P)-dependent oxidoreductase [Paracoccaceae bacterium]
MLPFDLSNKLAVITGAGSGIGAALARSFANRGTHLALVDVNANGLESTRQSLQQNVRVSLHPMDVTDKGAVDGLPATVEAQHGAHADVLINNAGVALEGNFDRVSEDDFDWVLDINLNAPIRLTRAFLPSLTARPDAQIVNISSVFGLIGPPGQTAYSTAKFGLRGFTEALRHEMAGTNLRITQVHPGGVSTNIANSARMTSELTEVEAQKRLDHTNKLLKMPPDQAAEIIARGIEKGKPRILIGDDARKIDIIQRLMPAKYWNLIGKQLDGS